MRFSEEFEERVATLTPRQQAAIVRMVPVLGNGGSIRSLTSGPDKVCAWRTYWKPTGWRYQADFQAALALGLEEYRAGRLQAVERAADDLRAGSEEAAELARAIVRGVLGEVDNVPPVVRELLGVLLGDETSNRDRVAAGRVLMAQGLRSAMTILDRAGVETAVRDQGGDAQKLQDWLQDLKAEGQEPEKGAQRKAGVPRKDGVGPHGGGVACSIPDAEAAPGKCRGESEPVPGNCRASGEE